MQLLTLEKKNSKPDVQEDKPAQLKQQREWWVRGR
jgi:hypothetical protein